jgi:predicted membrane-bound spermidine synthase
MNQLNEHRIIRGISFGLLILAILLFSFSITVNNGNLGISENINSIKSYVMLGAIMLGNLVPYLFARRGTKELFIIFIFGSAIALFFWNLRPSDWIYSFWSLNNLCISSIGYALLSMAIVILKKNLLKTEAAIRKKLIIFYIFTSLLQFNIYSVLDLTTLLHPISLDAIAYHIDATFGFLPSVLVAKVYASHQWFAIVLKRCYDWIPGLFVILFALQIRQKQTPPADILFVWAVSIVACLFAYHLCPISGPHYLFGSAFPNSMPDVSKLINEGTLATAAFRNGFPSMHMGACLMLVFNARYQKSRILNLLMYLATILTVLATLGTGEHYLIDLIVSFPFIVAIQSYCTRISLAGRKVQLQAIWTGISIWLIWVLLVRYGLILFQVIPGFTWVVSALTIFASLYAYRRIWPYEIWGQESISMPSARTVIKTECSVDTINIPAMIFIAGFTGLLYELIFSKESAAMFSSMASANYTVFAAYLTGLALGAWIGGIIVSQSKRSGVLIFAYCELIVAVYCLFTPLLFSQAQNLYVMLGHGNLPDTHALQIIRLVCSSLILLIPSICTGITLPALMAELQDTGLSTERTIATLYGMSALGAATAALFAGYAILPLLGIFKSMAVCALCSLIVALAAIKLNKILQRPALRTVIHEATLRPDFKVTGLLVLFVAGCVFTLLVVNYLQLLLAVAGSTSYAFSSMLISVFSGLAAGSLVTNYLSKKGVLTVTALPALMLSLACALLLGNFQWGNLPHMFAVYGDYPYPLSFASREIIRTFICAMMLFPPTLLIACCCILAMGQVISAKERIQQIKLFGSALSLNTMGKITGAVAGAFILLPALGTEKSIWIAAALCIVTGMLIATLHEHLKNPLLLALLATCIFLFKCQPATFNFTQLVSGSNIDFNFTDNGTVISHIESLNGGVTAVLIRRKQNTADAKIFVTNNYLKGDNQYDGQMKIQIGFAVTPLLFTSYRDSALVIGYGTGIAARTIRAAGFLNLDITEFSQSLLSLSNINFGDINKSCSTQPGVHTFITDARSYLLTQEKKYDLISVEGESIWQSNLALMYSQEFYALALKRMNNFGILQQRIQLRHLTPTNLASILSAARTVFSNVSLYAVGNQATIIASNATQNLPGQTAMDLLRAQPELMTLFNQAHLIPDDLTKTLVLSTTDVNRLLQVFSNSSDFIIASDENLYLEYAIPKSGALGIERTNTEMIQFLEKFSTPYKKMH